MNKEKLILSVGILNFLLPFGFIYNIIFILLALIFIAKEELEKIKIAGLLKLFFCIILFLLAVKGFISLNLVISIFVLSFLSKRQKYVGIGVLLIFLETSLSQNLISYFLNSSIFPSIGLVIPNILLLVIFFSVIRKIMFLILSLTILIGITTLFFKFNIQIFYTINITAFITLLSILININDHNDQAVKQSNLLFFILSVISLITFIQFNVGVNKSFYYLLPSDKSSYEAKYFMNYYEALEFTGTKFQRLVDVNDLTDNSLILIPWVSNADKNFLVKLNSLKNSNKKLTIIIAGEHTNYSGSRDIINEFVGKSVINDDLTVPRNNSDYSGFLRSIDFMDWPNNSVFNRGASTTVGFFDKTILSGDLWFSEPNINEWLWVGDYKWQPTDKIGRLPLATLTKNNNHTYLIFGDNSFLLNSQIIADPNALIRAINLSSIIPFMIHDLIISLIIILSILSISFSIVILGIIFSLLSFHSLKNESINKWKFFYNGQSGFDENNFNEKFLDISKELDGYHIIRTNYLNKEIFMENNNAIIFSLVDNEFSFMNLEIKNCFRTGSINYSSIRIMDGQFCKVNGDYTKFIGDDDKEFIFLYTYNNYNKIVILDRNFLSTKAPSINVNYIKKLMLQMSLSKSDKSPNGKDF